MSRAVKTDFEFNKSEFIKLLNKAKGSLSLTAFASNCNTSVSYMCKHLRGQMKCPPTPKTLKKISNFSEIQGVSYEDLLEAAGYSVNIYCREESDDAIIRIKTMSMADLGIFFLHKSHKRKRTDIEISLINITENSIQNFLSVEKFLKDKYDERYFVDVISIIDSEHKITVVLKKSHKISDL